MTRPRETDTDRELLTQWIEAEAGVAPLDFGEAVRDGLERERKSLPCTFLYDAEGSRLFEEICELPEYYLTRAETEILEHAAPEMAEALDWIQTLVELGSGSATKTEHLLEAFADGREDLRYAPIDVSRAALEESIERLEEQHPEVELLPVHADYEEGLARLADLELGPKLTLWLGSSIGNLERGEATEFLSRRRRQMSVADRLLVGIDLRKRADVLERAYDDSRGVTARFDLNLLERINRELGGDFEVTRFRHVVHYEPDPGRVRSYLESRQAQTVQIEKLDLEVHFEAGECIHTEDSHKYSLEEIHALAAQAGFRIASQHMDAGSLFSVSLMEPA